MAKGEAIAAIKLTTQQDKMLKAIARNRHTDLKAILKTCNPNFLTPEGETPFILALEEGNEKPISAFLMAPRLDVEMKMVKKAGKVSGIEYCIYKKQANYLKKIFENKSRRDILLSSSNLARYLGFTISNESAECLQVFIDAGVDMNLSVQDGITPLILAIVKENLPLCRVLMAHNADPSLRAADGKDGVDNALGFLCDKPSDVLIEILICITNLDNSTPGVQVKPELIEKVKKFYSLTGNTQLQKYFPDVIPKAALKTDSKLFFLETSIPFVVR